MLAVTAASAVSLGLARYAYPFVLPAMRDDILGSYGAAGLLGGVSLGAYAISMVVLTIFPLRAGPTAQIKTGLTGTCAGLIVMAVATDAWMLYLAMSLTGACGALIWIPTAGVVAVSAPPHRRGLAYGLMTSGLGISVVACGVLASLVQNWRDAEAWRELWGIVGLISVVVLVVVCLTLKPVSDAAVARPRRLRELRKQIALGRLCGSFGLYGIGFAIFTSYLIAVLLRTGMTNAEANFAYSLLGLTSIVSGVLLGKISDLWGRGRILSAGLIAAAGCSVILITTDDSLLLYVVVGAFGLVTMGIGSVLGAYLSDELPLLTSRSHSERRSSRSRWLSSWPPTLAGSWRI
ncbi:MFS transporter [Nocardioides alcanivorans]|uniref:MFS transporter n=1 Tax=Nocardioides alcanivorans TaxID=2897352 RepID=UPI001F39444F|nr:MFS transporter [Nocardioides alcanivorans]